MRDGGKGDKARPLGVDLKTFDNNWDAIFGKSKTKAIGDKVVKQVEQHIEENKNTTQRD